MNNAASLPPIPDVSTNQLSTSKFKRGDVVRLNSGGPEMTVAEVTPKDRLCNCWWFDPNKAITHAGFPEDCLTLVTP